MRQAREVQVLFEGLPSCRQATCDTGAQAAEKSYLPMRGLRKDFQAWQAAEADPRRSTTLRLRNRNLGNPLANFCDAGLPSVALKGWPAGIAARYVRHKRLRLALRRKCGMSIGPWGIRRRQRRTGKPFDLRRGLADRCPPTALEQRVCPASKRSEEAAGLGRSPSFT